MPEGAKHCSRCGKLKPLGQYSSHRRSRDGRQSACKLCTRIAQKLRSETPEYRASRYEYHRREDVKARKRAHNKSEGHRKSVEKYMAKPMSILLDRRRSAAWRLARATDQARERIAATVAAYDREIARVRAKEAG